MPRARPRGGRGPAGDTALDTTRDRAQARAAGPRFADLADGFDDLPAVMRRTAFPSRVPVVDVVAGRTLYDGTPDAARWARGHAEFVAASPAREGITARESGHYVFRDRPGLVAAAVANAYVAAGGEAARPRSTP